MPKTWSLETHEADRNMKAWWVWEQRLTICPETRRVQSILDLAADLRYNSQLLAGAPPPEITPSSVAAGRC